MSALQPTLAVVGHAMADVYRLGNESPRLYAGGNGLNVAVSARRDGCARVFLFGVLGDDAVSDRLRAVLRAQDVDISALRKAYGRCAQPYIELDERGERRFVPTAFPSVQMQLRVQLTQWDYELLQQADLCHVGWMSGMDESLAELRAYTHIAYDFAHLFADGGTEPWQAELLQALCPHIEFAFFSVGRLPLRAIRALCKSCLRFGCRWVCVTRGALGSVLAGEGIWFEQPALQPKSAVVDTLGAGDRFQAAFLTHMLQGEPPNMALRYAAQRASEVVTQLSALGIRLEVDG